jgi:hypothetical protein
MKDYGLSLVKSAPKTYNKSPYLNLVNSRRGILPYALKHEIRANTF